MNNKFLLSFLPTIFLVFLISCQPQPDIRLEPGKVKIVLSDDEPAALRLAVETLCNDFLKVTGSAPEIIASLDEAGGQPVLVIVNRETNTLGLPEEELRPLDDFESHRVWADPSSKRIYLDGKDMRGAIYAVYTFDEQFLGVPPLWFWSSWVPQQKEVIEVPVDTDLFFKSPQVRYRSWLPNDTDLYSHWKTLSKENNEIVYETMLRLKLNTMEDAGLAYPGVNEGMKLCGKYGLVVTSHHIYMLNTTFMNWNKYWKNVRGMDNPPELRLSNLDKIIEMWEYGAKTVADSGIENIWNIAFRGAGDQPFWIVFPDAPETEPKRAEVINRMLQIQMDIIQKYAKEKNPYVRITFYDEMADLVNSGLVRPPANENMIWTFCSGRRDHYPYNDIQQFNPETPVKLGYYMNLQFTSTGAHLSPAEGPWKMEFNYRYVNSKSPLYLSVVNSGNFREFLYTMSANAKMLWDYDAYSTDEWNRDYAAQYFGEEFADEIAQLYYDYFYSFWTQRKPDFPGGMERQFIFQDQRHTRAIFYISETFFNYNPDPLPERFGYERVPGRVFRVIPEDNGTESQVDAMLKGMSESAEKFAQVTNRCEEIMPKLPVEKQTFFYDNLMAYSSFMEHLSRTLYHYTYAYKYQDDKTALIDNLDIAYSEMKAARDALYATQHGVFATWYETDRLLGLKTTLETIDKTRMEAARENLSLFPAVLVRNL